VVDLSAKPYDVPCPKCSADPRERCRSTVDGQITGPHMSRVDDSHDQQ
jgi:hypothetical protein